MATVVEGPGSTYAVEAFLAGTNNFLEARAVALLTVNTPFPAGCVVQPALLWAPSDGTVLPWAAADAFCASAAFLGTQGWRQPTASEMRSMLGGDIWVGRFGRPQGVRSSTSGSAGMHDPGWKNMNGNSFIAPTSDTDTDTGNAAQAGCVRTLP